MQLEVTNNRGWSAEQVEESVLGPSGQELAAVVIYPTSPLLLPVAPTLYTKFTEAGIAVIFLIRGADRGIETVATDNAAGTALAVRHLYALGHRKIKYVDFTRGHEMEDGIGRLQGVRQACDELGVAFGDDDFRSIERLREDKDYMPSEYMRGQLKDFLQRDPLTTAVVCYNDWLAIETWEAAVELGLSVPGDLSIVGFDNAAVANTWQHKLTTIDPLYREIGATVGRRLIELTTKGPINDPHVERVRPELVVRESTAMPRNESPA